MLHSKIHDSIRIIKTFGNSMSPFLIDGDILFLQKSSFYKLEVDDIITVKKRGKIFTHRVIYCYPNNAYVITRGENSFKSDGKIYAKQYLGKVVKVERNRKNFNPSEIYYQQSSIYLKEIFKVNESLYKNEVSFVFLKGLPLHLHYQKTIPKRVYVDCDILINPKDIQKVIIAFGRLGYSHHHNSLSNWHTKVKRKISEFSMLKKVGNLVVVFDIHLEAVFLMTQIDNSSIFYPQQLVHQMSIGFLREKKYITLETHKLPILSKEDLIFYLVLHLFHHNYKGTHRYDFLDFLIRSGFNEKTLIKNINTYKLQNFVYPVFLLLRRHYKTPLSRNSFSSTNLSLAKKKFIDKIVSDINIFEDGGRVKEGINRFKNLFFLSPNSFLKKVFVFFQPNIGFTLLWVGFRQIKIILRSKSSFFLRGY